MNIDQVLAKGAENRLKVNVIRDTPLDIDLGLLTVLDPVGIERQIYTDEKEAALERNTRDGIQLLINDIFSQPVKVVNEDLIASLPESSTPLPREKPLPKAKPMTKWEAFAKAKGIAPKSKRDKLVFDEQLQDWVPRWGFGGRNKFAEEQWLSEVPKNADLDYNPAAEAKKERKARKLKNEAQHLKNLQRAAKAELNTRRQREEASKAIASREQRANDLDRQLHISRRSTASLGKFDKKFDGEPKSKGLRRHFDPNEKSYADEKKQALNILSQLDTSATAIKRKRMSDDNPEYATRDKDLINKRKAIKHMTKGDGVKALDKGKSKSKK